MEIKNIVALIRDGISGIDDACMRFFAKRYGKGETK